MQQLKNSNLYRVSGKWKPKYISYWRHYSSLNIFTIVNLIQICRTPGISSGTALTKNVAEAFNIRRYEIIRKEQMSSVLPEQITIVAITSPKLQHFSN